MDSLFEYREKLDALRFTPAQKAALTKSVAAGAARETRRARRPLRRTALVAAALVAALAVGTAGATGVLRSAAESFAGIFGGDVAQTEIIDKIGRPIGASATAGGVTITADAIIGDPYNACIVYTVTRDDGTPFDLRGNEYGYLPLHFAENSTDLRGMGGSHGSSYFLAGGAPNTVQFVENISSDEPLKLGTAKATFRDLCLFNEELSKSVPLVEGTWTMRFDVDYEDASVSLDAGETFQQGGMNFTITEVTVSPVAVRVAYEVDSEVAWSDAPSGRQSEEDSRQMQRYFENVEILLTKTDGTIIDLSNSGGSIRPQHGKTLCAKGGLLEQILPLEDLASISVGGVVLPLR